MSASLAGKSSQFGKKHVGLAARLSIRAARWMLAIQSPPISGGVIRSDR
ncbi:hypothetical protein HNR77_003466 [Paenibacillus sp. JGP012]|nr:hypothetical protein [Paenibacillus sp. JGP012]MBB6022369.1 hypothetical protein [Paenibacillus sp. JGP012]